ncbi:MAG TPA: DinB family protein [Candidatus Angelobacter sp.]|nr:DinB family protein [Candidatus Angelobacter sp.]
MHHNPNVAITPEERKRLTAYLAETCQRLLGITRGLTPEQLDHKPAPDRWSVAENLEHLTIAEGRVLPRIEEALKASPDPGKRSAWEGREDELVRTIENREPRAQAPEPVQPKGQWRHQELFCQLEAVRHRTLEFAATTNAGLRHNFYPHPFFGELDCYQWLMIMGSHFERHRRQIEEIMADSNFPRAAVAV